MMVWGCSLPRDAMPVVVNGDDPTLLVFGLSQSSSLIELLGELKCIIRRVTTSYDQPAGHFGAGVCRKVFQAHYFCRLQNNTIFW